MHRIKVLTIVAVAMFALAVSEAGARTITVPNGDFETIYKPGQTVITGVISTEGWTQGVGPLCPIDYGQYNFSDTTTGTVADIHGWVGYDVNGWIAWGGTGTRELTNGNLQGSVANQGNHTPGGINMYLVNGGDWGNVAGGLITSDGSVGNILNGCTYTLSMYAQSGGTSATPVVFDLLAEGVVLTPTSSVSPTLSSSWQEFSRTYDADDLSSYVGQAMTIVLGVGRDAEGGQTQFDDVTLAYYNKVIYVNDDASAGGDGSDWDHAYKYLQDGLNDAVGGDEIWVAAGTYYPTWDYGLGISDRGKHFRMINGVGIYGGFDGTETALDQRDVEGNETILSGDIGTPDDPNDNCYHVFYHPDGTNLDATAILEGFSITAGNASGDGSGYPYNHTYCGGGMFNDSSPTVTGCTFSDNSGSWKGGGMYNHNSSPTVTSCTFRNNLLEALLYDESYGGGMCNYGGSPTVIDCTFRDNSVGDDGGGGGMYNEESSPTVSSCIFIGNLAYGRFYEGCGGGMYNYNSSPTVTGCTFRNNLLEAPLSIEGYGSGMCNYGGSPIVIDCTFRDNSAKCDGYGGGMYNEESSPTVSNCTFIGNLVYDDRGGRGGGMYSEWSCTTTVSNCTFSGNSAYGGGGICAKGSATVTNCTFSGNSADVGGGGGMSNGGSTMVTNCIFRDNSANGGGGGMSNSGSTMVTNCTFTGNSAGDYGGGMYNTDTIIVTDCIFWGNTAPPSRGNEIALRVSSIIDVVYCDVQGGQVGIYDDGSGNTINWGGGNIDADPLFVDADGADNIPGTEDDDLHLLAYSPCIEAGDPGGDYSGQVDMDGDDRVRYEIVDMGADEVYPIAGDFEPDEDIDLTDLGFFSGLWLSSGCSDPDWCGHADFNISTEVNLADFAIFSAHWLAGVCFPTPVFEPDPADGAADVKIRPELSWSAGNCAVSHNIYFGTSSPGVFQRNQPDTTFDPGALELETMYYWRIDEVQADSSVVEGDVWRFTTRSDMLVGHWEFDESSGTVASDSVGSNDGTLMGNPTWRPGGGKIGGAVEFDGVGDYVEVTGYKGISGSNARTVSAWVKVESTGSTFSIVRWGTMEINGGLWSNVINAAGNLRAAVVGGSVVGDTTINDNTWHHVAIVLPDKEDVKVEDILLYVDGGQESTTISLGSQTIDTAVGMDVLISLDGSVGLLDDVRIYNYALSEGEIGALAGVL